MKEGRTMAAINPKELEERTKIGSFYKRGDIESKTLNRRWTKLQKMIEKDDDYFSEKEIKLRDPLLHHLYLGRYAGAGCNEPKNEKLSELLMDLMDIHDNKQILEDALVEFTLRAGIDFFDNKKIYSERELNKEEIEDNEDELIRAMYYKFVFGLDSQFFDYSTIDTNEEYDDIKQLELDEEDTYFNEEDPSLVEQNNTRYTGEQDF